jgi:hypothetical protein
MQQRRHAWGKLLYGQSQECQSCKAFRIYRHGRWSKAQDPITREYVGRYCDGNQRHNVPDTTTDKEGAK